MSKPSRLSRSRSTPSTQWPGAAMKTSCCLRTCSYSASDRSMTEMQEASPHSHRNSLLPSCWPESAHPVIAVHLDVLQQLEIVRRLADRDAKAGTRLRETAVLEEDALELAEDDVEHVRPGREWDAGDQLGHVCVDHLRARAPRKSDAVMAVDNEVRLPQLHRHDRRKRAVGERALE